MDEEARGNGDLLVAPREVPLPPSNATRASGPRRPGRIRVLLGIEDLGLHQEVLDFLDRDPRVEVVGAAGRPEALVRLAVGTAPQATVACPILAREVRHPVARERVADLLVVAEEMTVPVLRDAIEAGARGVFAWPDEREELARAVASTTTDEPRHIERGRVIAVFGARGGTGTTFVASHLAAAFADLGDRCVLVDLDSDFADLTVALGIESDARSIDQLIPVLDELSPEHVEDVLFHHKRGFDVLLASSDPLSRSSFPPGLYGEVTGALTATYRVVILHAPRALDESTRAALAMSDDVVLIVTPDLFSLYATRRAMVALGLAEAPERCRIVINPLARSEVSKDDMERILGVRPFAGIRFDRAVARAHERGQLLPARAGRAGRDVRTLARSLGPPPLPLAAARGGTP